MTCTPTETTGLYISGYFNSSSWLTHALTSYMCCLWLMDLSVASGHSHIEDSCFISLVCYHQLQHDEGYCVLMVMYTLTLHRPALMHTCTEATICRKRMVPAFTSTLHRYRSNLYPCCWYPMHISSFKVTNFNWKDEHFVSDRDKSVQGTVFESRVSHLWQA